MLSINVHSNIARLAATLPQRFEKQIAYAAMLAVNKTAQDLVDAERDEIAAKLEKHVPFTLQSVAMRKARNKRDPSSMVYLKDIGAAYIGPYITGGKNKLYGAALDRPVNIGLNSYGNIPRGKIKSLLRQSDVFAGPITFKKSGQTISGIWQRPPAGTHRAGKYGVKGNTQNKLAGIRSGLKLLVRFSDAHATPAKIEWQRVASKTVQQRLAKNFAAGMREALRTAR